MLFEPFFQAYAASGKPLPFGIHNNKEFSCASVEMKLAIFKAYLATCPIRRDLFDVGDEFLAAARPKKDLQLLKFFLESGAQFYNAADFYSRRPQQSRQTLRCYAKYKILDFVVDYRPILIGDVLNFEGDSDSEEVYQNQALCDAVRRGRLQAVKELIRHGVGIESFGDETKYPLLVAVENRQHNCKLSNIQRCES